MFIFDLHARNTLPGSDTGTNYTISTVIVFKNNMEPSRISIFFVVCRPFFDPIEQNPASAGRISGLDFQPKSLENE